MTNSTTQVVDEENGIMIRVDKTLADLNSEKPSSRWDPSYWHPKYDEAIDIIVNEDYIELAKAITKITYGAIVVGSEDYSGKDLYLINQGDISFTGINLTEAKLIRRDSPWNISRAKIELDDLILARSGAAGVGKNRLTINTMEFKGVVDSFVDLLRINRKIINPYYLLVMWKSSFGWLQVERTINGVGTPNISFDEIKSLKIPIITNATQSHIEEEYKKMSVFHDKAMEAKGRGNTAEYEKNIKIAEDMLRELIAKTEAVIRGEREDVV